MRKIVKAVFAPSTQNRGSGFLIHGIPGKKRAVWVPFDYENEHTSVYNYIEMQGYRIVERLYMTGSLDDYFAIEEVAK